MNPRLKILYQAMRAQQRKAWQPVIYEGELDLCGSKFGGSPWLAPGESWPLCQHCRQPLKLLLQLNLSETPDQIQACYGLGLIQLFYCTNWESEWCDCHEPFAGSHLVRRLPEPSMPALTPTLPAEAFPARMIADWLAFEDHPGYAELDRLGIPWPEDEESARALEELAARDGDKLGGWPAWSQEVAYPLCPLCASEMQPLFQIDSADNVPHLFGEGGTGHLSQCLDHPEVLAFGWGCS